MSSAEDAVRLARALEKGGDALVRAGDTATAVILYAQALRTRQTVEFHCDVDESAGLAEVVELHGYSRCVK